MRRYVLPIVSLGLLLLIIGAILKGRVFKKAEAGLQVNSIPASTVFLNEKHVGKTPFKDEKLQPGEITLRLVPEETTLALSPWETKIELINKVITSVNHEFGQTEETSAGEVMTLEKIADKKTGSLAIISQPDSCLVKIAGETKGFTPLLLEKLSEGEYQISVSTSDFKERTIRANVIPEYKLIINVNLAKETGISEAEITGTPTPSPTGTVTPKPTPKPTGPTPTTPPKPYVEIKETPTGWLRVRLEPSTTATEAAKVYPGEKYSLLDEEGGWYKIKYETDKEGWISGQYAEKYE